MATYKPAAHIADIRGHVQNTVYSRNRLGNYLKLRKAPLDRRTALQLLRRQYMLASVAYWHTTLSDAKRLLWNGLGLLTTWYNKAGIDYHPSGFNLFNRMYCFCIASGQAIGEDAPTAAAAAAPTFTVSTPHLGPFEITADAGWCAGKTGYVQWTYTEPMGNARYTGTAPLYGTYWDSIANIAAGIPTYPLAFTYPGTAGQRVSVTFKAFYDSGPGHTVTWPQIINQALT